MKLAYMDAVQNGDHITCNVAIKWLNKQGLKDDCIY